MTVKFTPGLKPNDPSKPRLYGRMFLRDVAPPATVDYSGFSPIGMLGNDNAGDCVEAGAGHLVEQDTFYGQGTEYVVSTQQAIAMYSQITGYNPANPNTDQGTVLQDGLDFMRKTGIGGHTIAAFAQLDVTNINQIKTAIAEFGSVIIGFAFPDSAMTQFNQGKPWTPVAGSPIDGGHCVTVVGYTSAYLLVVTWGKIQKMDYAFWNTYVAARAMQGEAWATVSQDWVNKATGLDPEGVDLAAFGAQYAALTNQPNPFPAVTPPVVVPPVVGPDKAELGVIKAGARYADTSRPKAYVLDAIAAWEKDKGFS